MEAFEKEAQPVVAVDAKKKELVGEFKNAGREWQPKEGTMHDFPNKKLGKALPYRVYDLTSNEGWVSLGIDHDTAEFAAASIGRWWLEMGKERFPKATKLLIIADWGGSNSSRNRLWKVALQALANELGLILEVCHFPPAPASGTKLSTECSPSLPKTGEAALYLAMRSSSASLPAPPPIRADGARRCRYQFVCCRHPG